MRNRVLGGLVRAVLRSRDDGQAMVEYALLIAMIAVVCFAILEAMGLRLSSLYDSIVQRMPTP